MPPSWWKGWRPGQREAIDEVLHHFSNGVPLVLLDAPTGTGKTLIGETVREELDIQGLYLCHSLTLQDQFAHDFPNAKVLKGRSNYTPMFSSGWGKVSCADCDKSDDGDGSKSCTYCDPVWLCPYEQAKYELLRAKSGCSNIRYFLTEANHVGKLSKLPFVILDECDVLESELMSYVEVTVTNHMRKLLKLPMPKHKTVSASWVEWFEKVIPKVQERTYDLYPQPEDSLMDKRRYLAVSRLLNQLKKVAPLVAEGGWVYSDYQFGNVTFKPIEVSQLGQEYVWNHAEKWLCMSATIVSPEEFVASTGYEGAWECVRMDSPFPVKRRPIRYVAAADMTHSKQETEWPKMAAALQKVIDDRPGQRGLVHTNSYALANYLYQELNSDRVYVYLDSQERADAIRDFEGREDAVLLASSLDRGYDGADDLVRFSVICKVPFPNIGDKQIQARLFSTTGGGTWYAVQTARSLVQAAGRGMRHSEDWCTVIILDSQFGRFWREWRRGGVHRLLPKWFCDAIVWGPI